MNFSTSRIHEWPENSHHFGADFLLAELERGSAFLDVAERGSEWQTGSHNFYNAIRASQTVSRFLHKLELQPEERRLVIERRHALRTRLRAMLCIQ